MMPKKGSVLITGAGGFIGSFLVRRFLRSGYKVIGIDRDPDVKKFSNILKKKYPNRFEFENIKFSEIIIIR